MSTVDTTNARTALGREDWMAIASRIAAIYFAASSLPAALGLVIALVRGGEIQTGGGITLLGLTGFLIAAVVLWFFPLTVARKLLPVMKERGVGIPLDGVTAFTLGITLVGFWLLTNGLLDAIYWGVHLADLEAMRIEGRVFTTEQRASMVATVAQIAVAVALVLGADGVRRGVFRLRYGRHTPAD